MAGNITLGRRFSLSVDSYDELRYIGGILTLNGVPVRRGVIAFAYPDLVSSGYVLSDPDTGHYSFEKLPVGRAYYLVPIDTNYNANGIWVSEMSPNGVDEVNIEMNPGTGGGGIDGYTLRSGDRLLVIDESGTLVGLPPAP
jgi:hypothetical protein